MSSSDSPTNLEEYATALETTAHTEEHGDLSVIDDVVREATVVALGEASHGVSDFHSLNHRLFAYLVERHDVRVFGLETHLSEALAIDRYVRRGEGTATDALAALDFWVWQTESVRAFLKWMREFNDGREPDDKIRFYGIDCQSTAAAAIELERYLDVVDTSFVERVDAELAVAREGIQPPNRSDAGTDTDGSVRERAAAVERLRSTLADRFETKRAEYVDATGRDRYELARRQLRLLEQATDLARIDRDGGQGLEYGRQRDEYMAENVEWILTAEDADSMAVWAANGHIQKGTDRDPEREGGPLGSHLLDAFGEDYRAFALEFGSGGVRTLDVSGEASFPAQSVASPPDGTLHATLIDSCDSPAYFDLQRATTNDALVSELTDRRVHMVGPGFDPGRETGFEREYRLDFARWFDGLFFIPEVSAADLLPMVTGDASDE